MSGTADPAGEARPFSVMSKPVGPRCNIDCAYCYYLDKEKLYPDERRFRMSETVLEAYVRQMIGAARRSGQKAVQFSWQGGEPTLRGLGTRWMQFIPVVERRTPAGDLAGAPQIDADPANLVTDWSVRPRAYGKFLCDVFDSWFRADVGKISVQFFDEQIALRRGLEPSLCILAETCGNALALEHNGDLYACDHYVYPEYRIGNILSAVMGEMAGSERMTAFGEAKRDGLSAQCRRCSFRPLCNGGCPKHRFLTSKDGEAGQNYFCDSYTMFLRHAGERLGALAFAAESGMGAR